MDASERGEIRELVRSAVAEEIAPLTYDVEALKQSQARVVNELGEHGDMLKEHARLLTEQARILTTTQATAFEALTKSHDTKHEQDVALKSAIEIQNKAISDLRTETRSHLGKQDSALATIAIETKATLTETRRQNVVIQGIADAVAPKLVRNVLPYIITICAAIGAFYAGCQTAKHEAKDTPAQTR